MSLKSRLLGAFCVFSLIAFACATQQGGTAGGSSTVEELPAENQAGGTTGGAAAAAPAGPQLNTFGSPEDGFTAKMPGTPQVNRSKETITDGDLVKADWVATVDNVAYSLSTAEYPVKTVAARAPDAFLNKSKNDFLTALKGTLKSEEAITLNNVYPGKAFVISSENGELKGRAYLVGPRLYTLFTLYNPSIGSPAGDAFLNSLTLINPPAPVERAKRTRATDGGTPMPGDGGTPTPTPMPGDGGTR
ncbi:MAG TPA: hypothetical protein VF815_16725 [Myxococcaceae bacterium]|jgi:hypothetical protein